MYRRLDGARIVETLERLRQRVEERFPGSGLEHVSRDLLSAASESMVRLRDLRRPRSEEHTSELQSRLHLVCRLLLEKKKKQAHHPPPIGLRNERQCT